MTIPSCFANGESKGNILVETYSYLSVGSPNHATLPAVTVDDNVKPPWKIKGGDKPKVAPTSEIFLAVHFIFGVLSDKTINVNL